MQLLQWQWSGFRVRGATSRHLLHRSDPSLCDRFRRAYSMDTRFDHIITVEIIHKCGSGAQTVWVLLSAGAWSSLWQASCFFAFENRTDLQPIVLVSAISVHISTLRGVGHRLQCPLRRQTAEVANQFVWRFVPMGPTLQSLTNGAWRQK